MKHNFIRATAYPICAKNIVSQYFAKKFFAYLKCIQKLRIIKKFHQKILIGLKVIDKYKLSKIEGFLRLFRKQGRNKKKNAWGKP